MSFRNSAATQRTSHTARVESDPASGVDTADGEARQEEREVVVSRMHRAGVVARTLASYRRRRGGGASAPGDRDASPGAKGLLSDAELATLERTHAEGITAVQVVDIFASRGVRFSEASFRKYVQQGLLPRSRRVGRKGKHRGSMGVYPAKTVRRINEIKRWMGEGYTIEEIQAQFLRFADVMEGLEEGFSELFARLDEEVAQPHFDRQTRKTVTRELRDAQKTADELMARLEALSQRVAQPREDEYRNAGAAGSAEDLL